MSHASSSERMSLRAEAELDQEISTHLGQAMDHLHERGVAHKHHFHLPHMPRLSSISSASRASARTSNRDRTASAESAADEVPHHVHLFHHIHLPHIMSRHGHFSPKSPSGRSSTASR